MNRKTLCLLAVAAILGAASVARSQELGPDPLGDIALEMDRVVIDLSGLATGEPTQQAQKKIVGKLDTLIARLEEEAQSSRGNGSGANPTRPLADSQIIGGPGGIGDLHAARKAGKQWGELPPHQRDRIVQSLTEGFPAHYQKILERYYKRLAEETPAPADGEREMKDAPKDVPPPNPAKKPAKAAKPAATDGAK